jgi:hypothetical protein
MHLFKMYIFINVRILEKTIFQLINETEDIMKKEGDAREESLQIRLGMALRKEQELLNETQQKQAKIELMEKQTVNLIKMNTDFITSSQQRQQAAKALEDKLNAVMEEKKDTLASFEQDKQKVESLESQLKEKEEMLAKYQQGDQKMVSAMNENQALKQTVQRLEQQLQEQKNTITVGQPAVTNNSNGLELQLKEKESMIRMLTRENEFSQKASTNYQQASDTTIDTFRSLVKSKDSEIDLLKSNIQAILDKESMKYITLEKEYRDLKRRIDDYPALLNDCSDSNSITTNTRNNNNEVEVRVKAENGVEDNGSTVPQQLGDKRRRLSS